MVFQRSSRRSLRSKLCCALTWRGRHWRQAPPCFSYSPKIFSYFTLFLTHPKIFWLHFCLVIVTFFLLAKNLLVSLLKIWIRTSALTAAPHTPGLRKATQPLVHSQTESKCNFVWNSHSVLTIRFQQANRIGTKRFQGCSVHGGSGTYAFTSGEEMGMRVLAFSSFVTFFVVVAKNSVTWAEEAKQCFPGVLE